MIEKQITLRDAIPGDKAFLARLYSDTRRTEVSAWDWSPERQEMFLRMQFDAQSRSYQAAFPDAVDRIVCLEDTPVGRMLIAPEVGGLRLVDIALMEEHRNRGIGAGLICLLQQSCEVQGKTLRLQVLQGNPAIRLYQRRGFTSSGADSMYVQMEWIPSQLAPRVS